MRVAIIGAGYVGLTTGACLSELGHLVACVDSDPDRTRILKNGELPIHEPRLEDLVHDNLSRGRLRFCDRLPDAVRDAEIVIIAVGTPMSADGGADLTHVKEAARQLATAIRSKTVITIKSTVSAGTARLVREVIAEARGALDFWITSNPEFLREGQAVKDFFSPDRIVIGADDPEAAARVTDLYLPMLRGGVPLLVTTTVNAELIKYAANAFLALKIGFIDSVADLCERLEADVTSVAMGIGLDHRIGPYFLSPGPGFGGSCFPKDTAAFAVTGRQYGAPQPLIETLVLRNETRKRAIASRILAELAGRAKPRVAVLGVAFKADTDDVRESAALTIIPQLQRSGVTVSAFDPQASETAARHLKSVEWRACPYEACRDADLAVILTEWSAFRALDLERLAGGMRGRTLFDCRNLFEPQEVARRGLRYVSIGRPAVPRLPERADIVASASQAERRAAASARPTA